MKKRFLIMALIICLCTTFVSCKKRPIPEEKPKDNTQIDVKEKKIKENIEEDEKDKKPDENKDEKKEKGLKFTVKDTGGNGVKKVSEKNSKVPFDIYTVGMEFTIELDGTSYNIKDAISKGILDEDKLIQKLKNDRKNGKSSSEMYKDGGTIIYRYKDYSIVKYNSIDGDEDMYITREKDLDSLDKILNKN